MSKRIAAKHKIDRRLGVNLWGDPKSPVNRRQSRPGQHGAANKKFSDYANQLRAKQKLKGYYGNIGERQFEKIYDEALRRKGDSAENLIQLLERRLDATIYRMKFAPTVFAARQIVNHGHILVNGKMVNIPGYRLRDGDTVEVRSRVKQNAVILMAVQDGNREIPDYLTVDTDKLKGSFVRAPGLQDVPYPVQMEPNLVIEYYSR
jgi:small subunit ribosomal protein S4